MRWNPDSDDQSLDRMTDTQEERALEEFCTQLSAALDNYLSCPHVADASHRAGRVLNALASVTEDMNKRLQHGAQLN
jgi:hypothetical protein